MLKIAAIPATMYLGHTAFMKDDNKPYPNIKSKKSLVNKYVSPAIWDLLKNHKTKTSEFTLEQAIICAVDLDNQNCGIYAGDADCYSDFSAVFHPVILDYH